MDAGAGPLKAGRYAGAGPGWTAAVVQGDAGRGHAPRRVPQNHGGAPAAVSGLETRTHAGATGPFQPAAQTVATTLGSVRGDGGVVGAGLFECCGSLPGARIGSRARDRHTAGVGRFAWTDRPAVSRGQCAACAYGWNARSGTRPAGDAHPHRVPASRRGSERFALRRGLTSVAFRVSGERGRGSAQRVCAGPASRAARR